MNLNLHPSEHFDAVTDTLNRQPHEIAITHHKNAKPTKVNSSMEVYGVEAFLSV